MLYTLIIIFKNRIKEKILPDTGSGSFRIDISEETGKKGCFLELENENGVWCVKENEHILLSDGERIYPEDGKAYVINIKRTSVSAALTFMSADERKDTFIKYILPETVYAGSSPESDIVINHEFVSRNHALITASDKGYFVEDLSRNGVFVNGRKLSGKTRLQMFDSVWIFGVKIVFLEGLAAISVNSGTIVKLKEADELKAEKNTVRTRNLKKRKLCRKSENQIVRTVLKSPEPEVTVKNSTDISDILKPAVPSAAVLSSSAALIGSLSVPALAGVFAGTTAALSAAMYGISSLRNRKKDSETKKLNAEKIQKLYSGYEESLKKNQDIYRKLLSEKYISASEAADSFFYEKYSREDPEFLKIRAGNGKISFRKFTDLSDNSDSTLVSLYEKYSEAEDMPLILDLAAAKRYTVSGERESVYSEAAGIAMLCASLFRPSDVKLVNISGTGLRFIRWFEHAQSDNGEECFTAYDEVSYRKLLFMLSGILQKRYEKRKDMNEEKLYPHYIVFCPPETKMREEPVFRYAEFPDDLGVTFIFLKENESGELKIAGSKGTVLKPEKSYGISPYKAEISARRKSSLCDMEETVHTVPDSITFLQMTGNPDADSIDISENYRINRASEGLRACIGTGKNGRFILDLHESMHGPHGLVAGTTGSGKSEMLQTLILALALGYPPSELSFVLIDYKGGGMSQFFETLPHTAGIITNISEGGNTAGRALVSLKSEIRRRQQILREYHVNSTDTYMKLYREGKAVEPMSHIIIICDEFAELKREKPDFISQLVSTSRIGRSLGMHLILATQRPAGVIDNEIWSNSRFRICLKVQDRNDSTEMLRRPEAADIRVTGRAFVQVGNDEIFEEIQTGYSGAVYENGSDEKKVRMLLDDGTDAVVNIHERNCGKQKSQLEVITERISEFCTSHGISSARKLWTEPLPSAVFISDISDEKSDTDSLAFTAGLADDPEEQRVFPVSFDFYTSGNILAAGMAGSGKTNLIMTSLCSLSEKYSHEIFRFSVADFAGGAFAVFRNLPQCRRILSMPSEDEMSLLLDYVSAETERRRDLFIQAGADDYSAYRKMSDKTAAEIIYIDGYYIFREMYPELDERFISISGNSAKYGIYFFVTVKQLSDMRQRTRQNFRTVIALELSDRTEYTELFGIRPEFSPASCPGRGMIKSGRRILEFQTALCSRKTGNERADDLSERFSITAEKFHVNDRVCKSETDNIFCRNVPDMTDEMFAELVNDSAEEGRVMVWLNEKCDEENPAAVYFYGADGMFSLLLELKHIFAERNSQRKKEGSYFGSQDVTVIFKDLDDVCRCIYNESSTDDMSAITETFFEKGSGLGVRFISGISEKSTCRKYKAFGIFISYNRG